MNTFIRCVLAGLVVCAGLACAETADEIAQLAQKGLGEDVLLAAVERSDAGFALNADQVVRLKQAGVGDKVVAAMLRKKAAAPAAPVIIAPAAPAAQAEGSLNLENLDEKTWGFRVDTLSKILWFQPAAESEERTKLVPHGGISLRVPTGSYQIRFAGESAGEAMNVRADEKAVVLLSRIQTAEYEGLYVSVFEKGERAGGGKIVVLRQGRASAPAPAPGGVQERPAAEAPRTTERYIERERIVEQPSTTVIYREPAPVYVAPPYYYPSYSPCYYPSYYYPYRNSVNLFYGQRFGSHGHNRVGVGLGFGF